MTPPVLFVDDEPAVLEAHQRQFRKGYRVDVAESGVVALERVARDGPYAVVVADLRMPGIGGLELLVRVAEKSPDTVRIMLTGNADQQAAMDAVNRGHVYQFLTKPCAPDTLRLAVENGVRQYALITAEHELLEQTLAGSIRVMSEILSLQDPEGFRLGEALRESVRIFATSLPQAKSWELELGAMLSPIGCVTVPTAVLERHRRGRPLSVDEEEMIRRVPEIGAGLLAKIPRLEEVSRIVLYQRKDYDGGGFPEDSIAGDHIPPGARLLRVLHDLHELEGQGMSRVRALEEMREHGGRYDPAVLRAAASPATPSRVAALSREAAQAKPVRIAEVHVGQVLAGDIETLDGVLLVTQGTRVTPLLLERLRNFARSMGLREPVFVEV